MKEEIYWLLKRFGLSDTEIVLLFIRIEKEVRV